MAVKITTRGKKAVQISARKKPNRGNTQIRFATLAKALGVERMALVESRLLNGEAGESVAKAIKMEWGLMPDHKLSSLAKILTEYRRVQLHSKLVYLNDKEAPRLSDFADKVDVLENLTKLVELQQTRVSKAMHLEKQQPKRDYQLRFEMELLGNLYVRLSTLQMDLGLLRKVPAKLQIEGMASRTQELLANAMSRSRRVDEALTKAFAVLDGKFSVVPEDATRKH
jgi:hypothetical protein